MRVKITSEEVKILRKAERILFYINYEDDYSYMRVITQRETEKLKEQYTDIPINCNTGFRKYIIFHNFHDPELYAGIFSQIKEGDEIDFDCYVNGGSCDLIDKHNVTIHKCYLKVVKPKKILKFNIGYIIENKAYPLSVREI